MQLKSELELVQCNSEQLVNCEDKLNVDYDRGVKSDRIRNNRKT
jgi:hypothetical protein